ncbi:MAG: hypothetical protein ACSLFQ_21315 [Thermoanaerobaculia bacterium]
MRDSANPTSGASAASPFERVSRSTLLTAGLLAAALIRLWIVSVQPIRAVYPSPHDDELFVNLAEAVIRGEWLGAYDQFTLAKGPMLSLLIAGAYFLGVPFVWFQQALYSAACVLCASAVDAAIGRRRLSWWVGIVLLANPMSYDGSEMAQVLRQNVFTSFSLLLLAATLALAWGSRMNRAAAVCWSVCWGVAGAGYYLTREETVWLVPSIVILLTGLVRRDESRRVRLVALAAGLAIASTAAGGVAWMNLRNYGWLTTNEFRTREFRGAYAALTSVRTGAPVRFVPVTAEARERLYRTVDSVALLRPHFESGSGAGWMFTTGQAIPSLRGSKEIGGGWLMWALRDAVAGAGFATSGTEAALFYRRLESETTEACRSGRLDCSKSLVPYLPRLTGEEAQPLAGNLMRAARFMATFENFDAEVPPSEGNAWSQARFREITGSRISPLISNRASGGFRSSLLRILGRAHQWVVPVLLLCTLPIWFLALRRRLHRSEGDGALLALALSTLVATCGLVVIVALIETTAYPAITIRYVHAGYPMMLLYVAASLSMAGRIGGKSR